MTSPKSVKSSNTNTRSIQGNGLIQSNTVYMIQGIRTQTEGDVEMRKRNSEVSKCHEKKRPC